MRGFGVVGTAALLLLFGATLPALAQEEHHESEAKPTQQAEKAKPEHAQEQAKPAKQESENKSAPRQAQAKTEKPESQSKPAKQESEAKPAARKEQAKPVKQEEQAKAVKPESPTKQEAQPKPAARNEQAKPVKQEEKAKPVKQQEQAKSEKQESPAKQATHEQHGSSNGQQHAQRTPAEEQRQRAVPALRLSARGSGRIPDDRFRSNFGREHVFVIDQPIIVGGYSRFQYGGYYFGFVQPWPVDWYYTDDVYVDYIDGGYYLCNPYYPGARVSISVVI
jgi:hypothetical protein